MTRAALEGMPPEVARVLTALRHDLRNPLTVIATNAALLLEGDLTAEQRRALVDMHENAKRLAAMMAALEASLTAQRRASGE